MNRFAISLITAAFAILPASAQEYATRFYASHGPANCQAALPAFETSIRKRPLGIVNEGDTTVFITCDSESNNIRDDADGVSNVFMRFVASPAQAGVAVSCTLVDGYQIEPTTFHPQTTQISTSFPGATVSWSANDNGGQNFYAPAISCALPPHVQMDKVIFMYRENVTPDPF